MQLRSRNPSRHESIWVLIAAIANISTHFCCGAEHRKYCMLNIQGRPPREYVFSVECSSGYPGSECCTLTSPRCFPRSPTTQRNDVCQRKQWEVFGMQKRQSLLIAFCGILYYYFYIFIIECRLTRGRYRQHPSAPSEAEQLYRSDTGG